MDRVKYLSNQLGKKIQEPGAHIPNAAVGIIRKRRTKKQELKERLVGGHGVKPTKENNPYPVEFSPASL
jgi:hypothetical protein